MERFLYWGGGKEWVRKWDLPTNEVTEHRFSKHWNTWFNEHSYFEKTVKLNLAFPHDLLRKFSTLNEWDAICPALFY